MVVVITYDEGSGGRAGQSCAASSRSGCRIATVVISPTTHPGTRSARSFSHYSAPADHRGRPGDPYPPRCRRARRRDADCLPLLVLAASARAADRGLRASSLHGLREGHVQPYRAQRLPGAGRREP
jgi:hypothetical protein